MSAIRNAFPAPIPPASILLVLLAALAMTACGNKADLFLPPPPEDEEILEDWDEGADLEETPSDQPDPLDDDDPVDEDDDTILDIPPAPAAE